MVIGREGGVDYPGKSEGYLVKVTTDSVCVTSLGAKASVSFKPDFNLSDEEFGSPSAQRSF